MQRRHVLAGPLSRSKAARPAASAPAENEGAARLIQRVTIAEASTIAPRFKIPRRRSWLLKKLSDSNRRHRRQAIVKDLFKFEAMTFSCHRVSASPYR
jgi:hypothetical protein